ncbi:hypothetical protein [Streptomyces sp. NPDC094049]|uniref:hypothetical protein n=1 Tax=Streptomyces sp. NPDC094049 TaxID=3154987 RepID=UPI003317E16D
MTHVFYSDAVEKVLAEGYPVPGERAAVMSVRVSLEEDPTPDHARGLPDADPRSESYGIDLRPEQTGGRGITVVYRH